MTGTDVGARAGVGVGCRALGLLRGLLLQALALELRQIVHEQLALEVVHLVLYAHAQQPLGLELEGFPSLSSARTLTFAARST